MNKKELLEIVEAENRELSSYPKVKGISPVVTKARNLIQFLVRHNVEDSTCDLLWKDIQPQIEKAKEIYRKYIDDKTTVKIRW